jgi:hypothetical protein
MYFMIWIFSCFLFVFVFYCSMRCHFCIFSCWKSNKYNTNKIKYNDVISKSTTRILLRECIIIQMDRTRSKRLWDAERRLRILRKKQQHFLSLFLFRSTNSNENGVYGLLILSCMCRLYFFLWLMPITLIEMEVNQSTRLRKSVFVELERCMWIFPAFYARHCASKYKKKKTNLFKFSSSSLWYKFHIILFMYRSAVTE